MSTIRSALFWLLVAIVTIAVPAQSEAAVFLSVTVAPPPLLVYAQPVCPGDGYIWVPGYWAYGPEGFYWVSGAWVRAPFVGALWTPGYWEWRDTAYFWNEGYWGPSVGFYGGINYGFGYFGSGYLGGYWNHGVFRYNRAVNNLNISRVHNFYSRPVVNNVTVQRVSYHGGAGGTTARPTRAELAASRGRHIPATAAQTRLQQTARASHAQVAGRPVNRPAPAAPRVSAAPRSSNSNRTAHPSRPTPHIASTPRPVHSNARSVSPPRTSSSPAVGQAHSALARTAAPQHSAPQPRVSSRGANSPRPGATRVHSAAPPPRTAAQPRISSRSMNGPARSEARPARPAPAQRASRPAQHEGAPRSHSAPAAPRAGEKPGRSAVRG